MKRTLFFFLLLLTLIMMASCSMDANVPENGDTGEEQTPDNDKTYLIPFLAVARTDSADSSRGIEQMPTGGPWSDDPMRSPSVMQSLPVMIGLESLDSDSFEDVKQAASDQGKIQLLGFQACAETDKWKENEDGIYLRYTVEYDGTDVGFIEYYYSIEERKFSYRQMVMLTLTAFGEHFVLSMEYDDIPVSDTSQEGSFSFGQLEGGKICRNAFKDSLVLTRLGFENEYVEGIEFQRNYMSGTSSKNRFTSFFHPDLTEAAFPFDNEAIYSLIGNIDGGNGDKYINTEEEAKAADLDFMMDIARIVYVNADKLASAGPYDSYEAFRQASLKELCPAIEDELKSRAEDPYKPVGEKPHSAANPVIFSWSENKSAAAQTLNTGMEFHAVTREAWEKTDFGYFYDDIKIENMETNEALVTVLISVHLKACGIEDENYIKNYTYAELSDAYKSGMGIWPIEITNKNHSDFKTEYDQAVEDFYEQSGIYPKS